MRGLTFLSGVAVLLLAAFQSTQTDAAKIPTLVVIASDAEANDLATQLRATLADHQRFNVIGHSSDGLHLTVSPRPEFPPPPTGADQVDLIAVLSGHSAPGNCVVLDPARGAVLSDVDLSADPQPTVSALQSAWALDSALDTPHRLTLSFGETHNVDLPIDQDEACAELAHVVEQKLIQSPKLLLLDRSHLGMINAVRAQLKTSGAAMLGARRVLKLDIARDPNPQTGSTTEVAVTVTVCDDAGHPLQTLHASGALDPVQPLSTALSSQILAALPAPASNAAAPDTYAEADQFEADARLAAARNDWRAASTAADAAFALAPTQARRALLARTLILFGTNAASPMVDREFSMPADTWHNFDESFATLRRATLQLRALSPEGVRDADLEGAIPVLHGFLQEAVLSDDKTCARPDGDGLFHPARLALTPSQCADLSSVLLDYRDYNRQQREPAMRAAVQDETSLQTYSELLERMLSDECHFFCRSSNQYTAEVRRLLPVWAEAEANYHAKTPSPAGSGTGLVQSACSNGNMIYPADWTPPCWTYDATDVQQLNEALAGVDAAHPPDWIYYPSNLRFSWRPDIPYPKPTQRVIDQQRRALQAGTRPTTQPTATTRPARHRLRSTTRPYFMRTPSWPPRTAGGIAAARPAVPVTTSPDGLRMLYRDRQVLIDRQGSDKDWVTMTKPVMRGQKLYLVAAVAGPADEQFTAELFEQGIDSPTDRKLLAQLPLASADGAPDWYLDDFYLGDHDAFLVDHSRLLVLPMGSGFARCIDASKELPAEWVLNATDLGGQLFIRVKGQTSGVSLVQYDLATGARSTLVSSLRREKQSPFDGLTPMRMAFLGTDAPRDRIVFYACGEGWPAALNGLWEYSPRTKAFRLLENVDAVRSEQDEELERSSPPILNGKVMIRIQNTTVIYDLEKDLASAIPPDGSDDFRGRYYEPVVLTSWMQEYGRPGSGASSGDGTLARRIGDVRAMAQMADGGYPSYTQEVNRPVGPDRVLVGDDTGLWCVTPQ